jgi:FkbM family methyltransferase
MIAVCVVFSPYEPIRTTLAEMGWLHITPFYDIAEAYVDRLPMGNGWFSGALDTDETEMVRHILSRWDDDYSRAAHLQFLAWRMHRQEWTFSGAPVTIGDRFFIEPLLSLLDNEEFFLDAGAYHGTVTEEFIKFTNGRCRGIIAIEPDASNAAILRESLSKTSLFNDCNVKILQCALGEASGLLPFKEGLQLASRLDRSGTQCVEVCTLDEIVPPATFAKLHLEGGELEALRGGANWLGSCRPILMVTIYHNRDGIWKIPIFLMDNLPGYRFLLRLHAWCGTGAVLYGVPEERFQ